jgi:hypothetical protein
VALLSLHVLTQEDSNRFCTLDQGTARFKDTMKLLRKRRKPAEFDEVEWPARHYDLRLHLFSAMLLTFLFFLVSRWSLLSYLRLRPKFRPIERLFPRSGQFWAAWKADSAVRTIFENFEKC